MSKLVYKASVNNSSQPLPDRNPKQGACRAAFVILGEGNSGIHTHKPQYGALAGHQSGCFARPVLNQFSESGRMGTPYCLACLGNAYACETHKCARNIYTHGSIAILAQDISDCTHFFDPYQGISIGCCPWKGFTFWPYRAP